MNERFEKLAEQAKFMAEEDINRQISYNTELKAFAEKFAELIVRECAEICMEMSAKCAGLEGEGALAKDCAYWIKKDFGVEE